MPTLKFYDIRNKKPYSTDNYTFEIKETSKGRRYFAIAYNDSGDKLYRIVSKDFYERFG